MSISSTLKGRWGARLRTRFSVLTLGLGIAFGAVPVAVSPLIVDAGGGGAFDLLGCEGSESLVPQGGPYLCPDADYTNGNLGKNWNELDLVPMRLVVQGSGAYEVAVVAQYMDKGHPGFDFISAPVLNAALSDASCTAATVTPAAGAGAIANPGLKSDESIYRDLSITQTAGTTCVYDYYQRLALGASANPGSSLHSELGTLNGSDLDSIPGVKTVPLPVNPSSAPSLGAGLAASQGEGYVWTVGKSATPNPLRMSNTCNPDDRSVGVDVTITWARHQLVEGQTTVVESVYADNPTDRNLTASATATLVDAGNVQAVTPADSTGNVNVPASSSHYLIGTYTHQLTAGASSSYTLDVSGSFTDPVTHLPAGSNPQTASASASVNMVLNNSNANATVTDGTSISGANLESSIDSVSLAGGSLGGYVLGTPTTAHVLWTSPSLNGDGSVTLHETVTATAPTVGSGSLDDTATVVGSAGISTGINLQVAVDTAALFDLTIAKSIPDVLQGGETAGFDFTVSDGHGASLPASVAFAAGQTSQSTTLSGLAVGTYTVHEAPQAGWAVQPDRTVVAVAATCAATASFANTVVPASATVQKITVPAGHEAGWGFILSGPGTPANGEKVTTNGSGAVAFSTPLQEGDYTITEASTRQGWVQGAATGCSFTVDYPADAGRTFACQVTNVQASVGLPSSGTQGAQSGVQAATTVATPDTGADLPYTEAGLLVLFGGGLAGLGWRRSRRAGQSN